MDNKTLKETYQNLFKQCEEILEKKGLAYSRENDRLDNFKRLGYLLNLSPLKVWSVYFQKHIDAIYSYINGYYQDIETIDGRIIDAINYLILLYALIKESQK